MGADQIWRDYITEGVPASGAFLPVKSEIRAWARSLATTYVTLAAAASANLSSLAVGATVATLGRTIEGTGGATHIKLAAAPGVVTAKHFQSSDGSWFGQISAAVAGAEAYGVKGDGSVETTAMQFVADEAAGRDISLNVNPLVVSLTNSRGSRFTGPGKILKNATQGGQYQLNSYADRYPLFIGKEYLYRLFLRIRNGGTLTGFIYGDSTVATLASGSGFAGVVGEPQLLIPRMLSRKGVRNPISMTNRGVGGTKISDMSALGDVGVGASDIFFVKYGINDAADGLLGFATNLRAKMAAIRSLNGFSTVDNLTIVLIGPNATFDPQHGRASNWHEDLRGIYEAAARDYRCAYFDTYAYMREIEWAATAAGGQMMDNAFANGQGVHPKEIMQQLIYGKLIDEMIGFSDLNLYDSNSLTGLTMLNSWVGASGYQTPYASMDRDGWVTLGGVVSGGIPTSGAAIAQVPTGFKPSSGIDVWSCKTSAGVCGIRVNPATGNIEQHDGSASTTFTSLNGIRYPTR